MLIQEFVRPDSIIACRLLRVEFCNRIGVHTDIGHPSNSRVDGFTAQYPLSPSSVTPIKILYRHHQRAPPRAAVDLTLRERVPEQP